MASVSLTRVIEKMKLENLTPEIDVKHVKITQPDINRPALQLAGYFEHFDATRLQIIGFVEYTYMEGLTDCSLFRFTEATACGTIISNMVTSKVTAR